MTALRSIKKYHAELARGLFSGTRMTSTQLSFMARMSYTTVLECVTGKHMAVRGMQDLRKVVDQSGRPEDDSTPTEKQMIAIRGLIDFVFDVQGKASFAPRISTIDDDQLDEDMAIQLDWTRSDRTVEAEVLRDGSVAFVALHGDREVAAGVLNIDSASTARVAVHGVLRAMVKEDLVAADPDALPA